LKASTAALERHVRVHGRLAEAFELYRKVSELIIAASFDNPPLYGCSNRPNSPIEKLWNTYGSLLKAVMQALAVYTPQEQLAILGRNARAHYRIDEGSVA
jgi:hypothetical protein